MILKTIVCDGPTCEQAIRVPLDAPLRDLLPTGWYALAIPPEEVDAHFCSKVCMTTWALALVQLDAPALTQAERAEIAEELTPPHTDGLGLTEGDHRAIARRTRSNRA